MPHYLLSIPRNEIPENGTIHDLNSKLKVNVSNLSDSSFAPSKGEVRFFVTAGKEKLAFETKGYKRHRELLILNMISWYCIYLGLLEAQIHSSLPV